MILELNVAGYRSIQDISLPLTQVNIITGPNGCGKSNLYHSMLLIAKAATGQLSQTLAMEGGMPSVLWAGERKQVTRTKKPVRMSLGMRGEEYSYELICGLPPGVPPSLFDLDPQIKEEYVWHGKIRRKATTFLERKAGTAWVLDQNNKLNSYPAALNEWESVLSQLLEPHLYPELSSLRHQMSQWRFYHQFRTDADSPIRQPQVGVRTPVLSNHGHDLAAALQTIIEIGDEEALHEAIDQAFPGARLTVACDAARFSVALHTPGIKRAFTSQELSDGTLRYLCLVAALLSPRPPMLLALNEPETSLHPDLMIPLANLLAHSAQFSQLWVTTHSQRLAKAVAENCNEEPIKLQMVNGETLIMNK